MSPDTKSDTNSGTNSGTNQENFQVDLTNCDREPIHIPGQIQAHGVLAALDDELNIRQISQNCVGHFGVPADEMLGRSVGIILNNEYFEYLKMEIAAAQLEGMPLYLNPVTVDGKTFEVLVHRSLGILILEFELPLPDAQPSGMNAYSSLRAKLNEINESPTLREFCARAAETVRLFTGFDRVMIYRFLEDDSGEVVGEALKEGFDPFFGLRYPASDIPKQARALYLKQTLRFKTDVDDIAAPLVPALNPPIGEPLDLSFAATRAMSPIHVEYLKNMGVTASMSISIVKDNKLWGLIACHHAAPRYIPHQARMICEFLAHTVSLQIESKVTAENYEYLTHLKDFNTEIIGALDAAQNIPETLIHGPHNLLSSLKCGGAALVLDNRISLIGETPGEIEVQKLVEYLWKNQSQDIFSTNRMSALLPSADDYSGSASGVLAVRLTQKSPEYLLWFRPAITQTIKWAGNPEKPVIAGQFGERLSPRKSFEVWQQEVSGQAAPWQGFEIDFAGNLRRSIVEIILRRIDELSALNKELEASNTELDSFAYVASHDLKEPLRGINNYSNFLLEDYAEQLDEEAVDRLKTLVRLTDRMESLLDSLLNFSRVGRIDLQKRETSLQDVLDDSLLFLRTRIEENNVIIEVPRPLPPALVDEIRISEIFVNLISNAVKYNDKELKKIEIGYLDKVDQNVAGEQQTERIYYVRDNGIGIEERHHQDIFRIFKRLHGRHEYSGGVGAGLTIVKKIVERHGGQIRLESKIGEGTTFYFTIG